VIDAEFNNLRNHFHLQIDKYIGYHSTTEQPKSFTDFYQPFITILSSIEGDKCSIENCKKKRKKHSSMCSKHNAWRHKQLRPLSYVYSKLKYNAKYRRKEFTLTLRYFRLFCWYHDYNIYTGRKNNNYNIDRIDNKQGYVRSNLQILTKIENVKKYHQVDKHKDLPF